MSTPPPQSTRTLSIYNDCTQMVENYPKYTEKIPLPKSTDLASLLITDTQGTIIPFRYKNPHPNPHDTITVIKGSITQTGKLVSLTDTSVILQVNDTSITIRNYDMVTIHDTKMDIDPYIKIKQQEHPITITYLFSEITWKAIGTGIIMDSNINLRIASQIHNTTDHNIIANVNCIAGAISSHRPLPHMMRALAVESPIISKIEDYTMYRLGDQKLKEDTVIELGTNEYPVIKFYEYSTNNTTVRLGYRFKTNEFIPNITIYMYTNDHNYLGTADLDEYQPGEEVDLLLGGTSMVRCETTTQVELQQEADSRVEHVETKIINHNTEDIFLVIKHHLGPKKLIHTSCQIAKQHDQYVEWYFLIHPNDDATAEYFRCSITSSA